MSKAVVYSLAMLALRVETRFNQNSAVTFNSIFLSFLAICYKDQSGFEMAVLTGVKMIEILPLM